MSNGSKDIRRALALGLVGVRASLDARVRIYTGEAAKARVQTAVDRVNAKSAKPKGSAS